MLQALTESTVPLSRTQLSLTHADFCAENSIFNTNMILRGMVCCIETGGYRTGCDSDAHKEYIIVGSVVA
ncbi:hypothetical protein P692DRAFT_20567254 [Suillus brevipes Sb2]|nr:hypothetical protein P692DRAFT_20567254 [Suillus brevipes Sb2]